VLCLLSREAQSTPARLAGLLARQIHLDAW
jgi:hypothetical protein